MFEIFPKLWIFNEIPGERFSKFIVRHMQSKSWDSFCKNRFVFVINIPQGQWVKNDTKERNSPIGITAILRHDAISTDK